MQVFNKENVTALQSTCDKISSICKEQVEGDLMLTQKIFLGELIKEFYSNPIVLFSGILPKD